MARKRSGVSAAVDRRNESMSQEVGNDLEQYQMLTSGALPEIIKVMDVQSIQECISRAIKSANEDDLVGAIIDTKVEFYSSGFGIQVNPRSNAEKMALRERINIEVMQKFEMTKVAEELIDDFCSCDNCILLWAVSKGTIQYVTTIEPSRVKYINAMGHERLEIIISNEIRQMIQAALNDKTKLGQLEASMKKYVDAVKAGKNTVELKHEDGEYWIVKTTARRFSGLAMPSMKRIFFDILLRRMLVYGDWTLAYFVKRIIEVIQSGESITNGTNAGTKKLYVTDKEIAAYKKVFKDNTAQALRLFANHTFKITHSAPDPKLFTEEKFSKVEQRILRWGGVIDTIMTGEGEGYASSYIGVRRFVAQGLKVRRAIGDMLEKFILHPSIAPILKIPVGSTSTTTWDEQNLKDYKQILDELTAIYDRGGIDIESMHERLGYNHNLIKARKKTDWKNKDMWVPTFEPRQGLLGSMLGLQKTGDAESDGQPGRPDTGKNTEAPGKPRVGRKGN